jgi:hypothetical protein
MENPVEETGKINRHSKKKDAHGRTGMLGAIDLKDSTGAINLAW